MDYKKRGSITIFLCLAGIFFLVLACVLVESVHTEGCRMAASQITDLGVFSIMGEYESAMLDKYDLFMLDGGRGSSALNLYDVGAQVKNYMDYHVKKTRTWLIDGNFTPWRPQISDLFVSGVTLATDRAGAEIVRQAVQFEKETIGFDLVDHFLEWQRQGNNENEANAQYQNAEANARNSMENAEAHQREQDPSYGIFEDPSIVKAEDPRKTVDSLKKKGILGLTLGESTLVSTKEVQAHELPSRRARASGTISVNDDAGLLERQAYFTFYLTDHFDRYPDIGENILNYQQEYLIAGKLSDPENLKSVINRILLMREGVNFICAWTSPRMFQETLQLALAVTGIFAIPILVEATQTALLLAWAYGESLVDLRCLMAGKKVALVKTEENWQLPLSQLLYLDQILQSVPPGASEGMTYQNYLNILLAMGNVSGEGLRAADLMEGYMKTRSNTSEFRIDHAITGIQVFTEWKIKPIFLSLPAAFTGVSQEGNYYYTRQELFYR